MAENDQQQQQLHQQQQQQQQQQLDETARLQIEANRQKALQRRAAATATVKQTSADRGSSSAQAEKEATTTTATASAASAASTAPKDAAPLAASRLTRRYYDYNLSSMKDSHGGFLIDEPDDNDANGEANGKDGQTASLLDIAAASKKRKLEEAQQKRNNHPLGANAAAIDAMTARELAKCEECSSQDVDAKYLEAFGVKICRVCKEALSEKYSLLTKTEVKSDYMLTDSELTDTKAMPYIEKPNPHKATWNNMRLYLRMQVEAFALKKWGSFENMDAEYQRREAEKVIKKEQRFKSKLDDLRRRTRTSTWKTRELGVASTGSSASAHVHSFQDIDDPEGLGRSMQQCPGCKITIECEDM